MTTKSYPPGPRGSLLTGAMNDFRKERLGFMLEVRDHYGDIAHFKLLQRHAYLLNHPDYIRTVLVDNPEKFHKSPLLKRTTRDLIGYGSLVIEDDYWKKRRRLIQPAFHHHRIAAYGDVMVQHTQHMLDTWHTGDTHDIAQEMMKLTLGIAAKTLFDADVSDQANEIGNAITVGLHATMARIQRPMLNFFDWLPTPANRERLRSGEVLHNVIMKIINDRRASGEDKGDLLSMLLLSKDEDGSGMTDRELHDEAMTLFIAGHETTALALTWALYLLAQNPHVVDKLTQELDAVLGARAATVNDLAALPYTEMVVKEALRMYPPAWVISRIAVEPVTVADYHIDRDSLVLMSPYVMHHDERYFPEAERFLPERFSAENEKTLPKYAYFPFGGGPRVCIGNQFAMMEARLVLATIMQHYRPTLVPGQNIVLEPLITLRPRDGIQMRLQAREPALA
ncbi:MAG: cytochrome P450 [Anaerolineae bacterium]